MPPGDDRLRTPICHANQGHIAALIHGDVRGDIGDLWWNCEDKTKFDLVRSRIMEGNLPGLLIYLPMNQSQPQTHLTGCTLLATTWVSEITSEQFVLFCSLHFKGLQVETAFAETAMLCVWTSL